MRSKCRVTAIALGLSAVSLAVAALFLYSDQSAGTRRSRLNTLTTEVRRGNYFAWGQVWMWLDKLSIEERNLLLDTCAQYAKTNHALRVSGCAWPPEQCATGMQPLADWMRRMSGNQENALVYDVLAIPLPQEIDVARFEKMFRSRTRVTP